MGGCRSIEQILSTVQETKENGWSYELKVPPSTLPALPKPPALPTSPPAAYSSRFQVKNGSAFKRQSKQRSSTHPRRWLFGWETLSPRPGTPNPIP